MSNKITTFLSSGCSFTAGHNTWPNHVANHFNLKLLNYGASSAGNGYISRSLIYGVNKILQDIDASELLVGVMWSGASRFENYHSTIDQHQSKLKFKYVDDDEGAWVVLNANNMNSYSSPFFRMYHDIVGENIITLEHILRTQWFLELKNISYFMSCYSFGVLPSKEMMEHPSIKHLYQMINWDKFLPVDNCMDWCNSSDIQGFAPDKETQEKWKNHSNSILGCKATHPTTQQHKGFAEKVIVPYIEQKISI